MKAIIISNTNCLVIKNAKFATSFKWQIHDNEIKHRECFISELKLINWQLDPLRCIPSVTQVKNMWTQTQQRWRDKQTRKHAKRQTKTKESNNTKQCVPRDIPLLILQTLENLDISPHTTQQNATVSEIPLDLWRKCFSWCLIYSFTTLHYIYWVWSHVSTQ